MPSYYYKDNGILLSGETVFILKSSPGPITHLGVFKMLTGIQITTGHTSLWKKLNSITRKDTRKLWKCILSISVSLKILVSIWQESVTCPIFIENLQSQNTTKIRMVSQHKGSLSNLVYTFKPQCYQLRLPIYVHQPIRFMNVECRLSQSPILSNLKTVKAQQLNIKDCCCHTYAL